MIESSLGTTELAALCESQIGPGPWFFWGGAGTRLQKGFQTASKWGWNGQFEETDCIVRRFAGGSGWDPETNTWATEWASMYVKGPTWEDCARQLGLTRETPDA
jgi:hypothetical protein